MPPDKNAPSLENLIESFDLGEEVLHPGGLATTKELAELCHIGKDAQVLDVACGSGEPLCFLVETFGCRGVGIELSEAMVQRAQSKAQQRNLPVEFQQGDAHNLPFDTDTFDVAISECTICLLNKATAIEQMVRVNDRGVPNHRCRTIFAKRPQPLFQLRGSWALLPRTVAAQGDEAVVEHTLTKHG